MCGIAGYVCVGSSSGLFRQRLGGALWQMAHRGPDGTGSWFGPVSGGEVGIGHTRLSILDLTSRGSQPMQSESGRHVLSYNGEIYNYLELREELEELGTVFMTDSDTEVLLAAWVQWGDQCLPKLNGMFAFAVYDSHDQILTLARDKHGMKPLYLSKQDNSVLFASEPPVAAGMFGSTAPNHQKVYEYLTMGLYDLDEQTFFDGVYGLPPGFIATVEMSNGRLEVTSRQWSAGQASALIEIDFDSAVDKIRSLFLESVELHLRSDVPVAVALSGGLDSTGIVGAVRHLYPDREIHTFSYGSPGFEKDESRWATMASEELGTRHHQVHITAEEAQASLKRVVREQGEPTNSSSVIAQSYLYKAVAESGFKVLLDGQGADELFAGYSGYIEFRLRSLLSQQKVLEAVRLLSRWKRWSPQHSVGRAVAFLAATYVSGHLAGYGARVVGRGAFPPWINRQELERQGVLAGVPTSIVGYPVQAAPDSQFLKEHLIQSLYGGDLRRLLRHGDRSSMAHSVESRLPYLGKGIVEFVQSLPEDWLLSADGEPKRLLRRALNGMVPPGIVERRDKVGFEAPEDVWMRNIPVSREMQSLEPFRWIRREKLYSDAAKPSSALAWRARNLCAWSEEFLR